MDENHVNNDYENGSFSCGKYVQFPPFSVGRQPAFVITDCRVQDECGNEFGVIDHGELAEWG